MPETNSQWLARRAAEIRAGQADAQIAGVADQIRNELAAHEARLGAITQLMQDVVADAGLTPPEPERPHLFLIRGEAS